MNAVQCDSTLSKHLTNTKLKLATLTKLILLMKFNLCMRKSNYVVPQHLRFYIHGIRILIENLEKSCSI